MVITDMIRELQAKLDKYGDLPIYIDNGSVFEDESEVSGVRYCEAEEELNECCAEKQIDDSDICPDCKEHCEFEGLPERIWLKL